MPPLRIYDLHGPQARHHAKEVLPMTPEQLIDTKIPLPELPCEAKGEAAGPGNEEPLEDLPPCRQRHTRIDNASKAPREGKQLEFVPSVDAG